MLKEFLKFIEYYGRNKKCKIAFFILVSVLAGVLEFVGIGLIYPFLIMIINPKVMLNNVYYTKFVNLTGIESVFTSILVIGFFIVSMFILKNLIMIACIYLQNKFVTDWKNDVNNMLMKYYLNAPYKKLFENSNSEKIYNMTVLSSQTLETFVLRTLIFITNLIIISIILSVLLIQYTVIAIMAIALVILCMIYLNKFFKNKTKILAPKMLEYSLKNNNQVIENIKNLKEIRIFCSEDYFLNKFSKVQRENNNVIFKNSFYSNIPPYIVEMILVLVFVMLAGFITYKNYGETSQIIASYGIILAVILRIAPSLNRIQVALNHMNSSKEMIQKMNNEYRKYEFDKIQMPLAKSETIDFKEKLIFKEVSYSYTKNNPVLKAINFEIKKGEFVGIVGLSGSGKSTIADILTGILPIDGGKILLDEQEITERNILSYRKLVGYVPQELNILDDTFKKNVAWGMEYYETDEKRVEECLKQACIYDFAEERGGINSIIKGLSQGQKQRLLIARALYKNPEIIIFDEATSSLDVETEQEITKMLTSLKEKATIIAIAHRLNTLKECDKLIYIKEGEIVDTDTFEALKTKYKDFEKLIKLSQI